MLHDKIDLYLDGDLNEKELKDFEDALKKDPKLAAKVKLHKGLAEAMVEDKVVRLEENMKAIFNASGKAEKQEPARVFSMKRLLSIAASVLILVVAGWWINSLLGPASPDELFADYISYPSDIYATGGVRSADSTEVQSNNLVQGLVETWEKTNTAFNQNKPEEALRLLELLYSMDANFDFQSQNQYYYTSGLIQLQLEEYQKAADSFTKVTKGNFKEMADWYLALSLLNVPEQLKLSKSILQGIADSNHPKKKSAKELLDKLN